MNQKYMIKYVVTLIICLMVTNCHKESSSREQMTENFRALVMGGKDIDPNQTWSTATDVSVTVSVNLEAGAEYKVYIYQTHPAASSNYLGMVTMMSGETKTLNVAQPTLSSQLFAACYDAQQHVMCMPVVDGKVTFKGKINTTTGTPVITTGNRWSVPYKEMPDLSKYTTGELIEVNNLSPDLPEDAEAHVVISSSYEGFIPFLSTHTNMSVYVTSTWKLTFDQRINNGNVIVVGKGGKIEIPKGFKLTTTPLGEANSMGRIYVMEGGVISGDGTVEFSSEGSGYNYNSGTISAGEVAVTRGSFYNAGSVGNNNQNTRLTGEADTSTPGEFINLKTAYLNSADGTTLVIMNAGAIGIMNDLTLGKNSRMDDNSSLTCGSLTLKGIGNNILYMGNGAYLNCRGSISVDGYGVWGPSDDKYTANARLRVKGCTLCNVISTNANEDLLDHVQIEVPMGATNLDPLSSWINGDQADIDHSRQTCFYVIEGTPDYPKSNYIFYAFEVPNNYGVSDFDYNDLILRVSSPYDNGDGTYTISVNVAAIGSDLQLNVLYNDEDFGKEVHEAMGVGTSVTVNTTSITRTPEVLGLITVNDPNIAIDKLAFSLRRTTNSGSSTTVSQSSSRDDAPLFVAISGDANGKWYWAKESALIVKAYPSFSAWANNAQIALDWYNYSNGNTLWIVK